MTWLERRRQAPAVEPRDRQGHHHLGRGAATVGRRGRRPDPRRGRPAGLPARPGRVRRREAGARRRAPGRRHPLRDQDPRRRPLRGGQRQGTPRGRTPAHPPTALLLRPCARPVHPGASSGLPLVARASTVPACAADAQRVLAGVDPAVRTVLDGSQRVPYWQAGPAYSPWAYGYYGAWGGGDLLTGVLIGTALSDGGGFGFGDGSGGESGLLDDDTTFG